MKFLAPFLALTAIALTACAPPAIERGDGPVLISVFTEAGTGAAPREGLFSSYGLGLQTGAAGFDAAALAALPQHVIETDFPIGADARRFSGPRLSDVLAASGAPGAGARLTAADGYQADVSAQMIARHEPILATHADGEALAVGGLGPAILVWPRGQDRALEDMNDDQWPWGVFAIEALES